MNEWWILLVYPWNLLATLQLVFRRKFKENFWSNVYLFSSVTYIKLFRQSLSEKVVYCSYPILPFGIVACTFFSDNLSRNSCIRFRLWVKPVVPGGGNQVTPVVSVSAACSVGFTEPPSMTLEMYCKNKSFWPPTLRLPSDGAYRANQSVDTILLVAAKWVAKEAELLSFDLRWQGLARVHVSDP